MYKFIKTTSRAGLAAEAPALLLSVLLAETFYKLGSFTLELVAFFFTWYVLSKISSWAFQK